MSTTRGALPKISRTEEEEKELEAKLRVIRTITEYSFNKHLCSYYEYSYLPAVKYIKTAYVFIIFVCNFISLFDLL